MVQYYHFACTGGHCRFTFCKFVFASTGVQEPPFSGFCFAAHPPCGGGQTMGRARLLPLLADEWTQLLDGPKCLDGVNEGGFNYSVVCVCVCVCVYLLPTRAQNTSEGDDCW